MIRLGSRFGKVLSASAISNIGDGVLAAAFPLVVASITRDPIAVAVATVARTAPWLLFALISGALVDRLDRRIVMVVTDLLRAALVAGVGVAVLTDIVSLPIIYAAAFALGISETFFDTSAEALTPAVVEAGELTAANGRLQAAEWVGGAFAGPPLGSLLFVAVASLPFFFNAGTYAIAALLIWSIRGTFQSAPSQATIGQDIAEGVRWLWSQQILRTFALSAGIVNLFVTAIIATFVLFSQDILGVSDAVYGVLLAAVGVGGLLGALRAQRIVETVGPGTTVRVALAGLVVMAAALGATSNMWLAGIFLAGFGFLMTTLNVVSVTLRQELTPDELRGRVSSASRMLSWGTQPLGAIFGGILASAFGLRAPFYVAAIAWLILFLIVLGIVDNAAIESARADRSTEPIANGKRRYRHRRKRFSRSR